MLAVQPPPQPATTDTQHRRDDHHSRRQCRLASGQRPAAAPVFDTNVPEQLLVLTNARARYTFTSRGGGLKLVELLDYPETISPRWKKTATADGGGHAEHARAAAGAGDSGRCQPGRRRQFHPDATADGVRAEKSLPDGLRLMKEFHLSSNYLVNASVRLENTSDKPLALPAQEWVVGTATPMGADDNGYDTAARCGSTARSAVDHPVAWFSGAGIRLFPRARRRRNTSPARTTSSGRRRTTSFSRCWRCRRSRRRKSSRDPVDAAAVSRMSSRSRARRCRRAFRRRWFIRRNAGGEFRRSSGKSSIFAGPKEYRPLAHIGEEFQNHADLVMQFRRSFRDFAPSRCCWR